MFKKIKYRLSVLKNLKAYTEGVKKHYVFILFIGILTFALSLILPMYYSMFVEKIILGGRLYYLWRVIIAYVVIQFMNTALAFFRYVCTYTINNHITVKIRLEMLKKKLVRPFPSYEKMDVSNEKLVMDEAVFKLCDFTSLQTSDYLINLVKLCVLFVALFYMQWELAIVLILFVPLSFFLNHRNGENAKHNTDETWKNDKEWENSIFASIKGWKEARAMNAEESCEEHFKEYSKKYANLFITYTEYWVTRRYTIPKIKNEFVMQFVLYFIGGILIYQGKITIGTLLVFAQYYLMLTEAMQEVVNTDTELQINTVYYDKAIAAMNEVIEHSETKDTCITNFDIRMEHISFQYPNGEGTIISDFSLNIQQGDRVGIVGESGRGKTTLLKLIVGMLEPTTGKVYFGGKELSTLDLDVVHKHIGFVLQESVLYNTTIRENLLYGNEDATQSEIDVACERVCIKEFIDSLEQGYETIIGEKGIKLSGGQRQRLVLARLLIRDVDLYILDEATSALDQQVENLIQEVLSKISQDKTIVVVAHRESSLRLCNRLIYL